MNLCGDSAVYVPQTDCECYLKALDLLNDALESVYEYINTQDALKQDKLTAGDYIEISSSNIISANLSDIISMINNKQNKLSAGIRITIEDDVISADFEGYATEKQLNSAIHEVNEGLSTKQSLLIPGERITIEDDGTISASAVTKTEILSALGYEEIELSYDTDANTTVKATVLGIVTEVINNGSD